MPTNDHERYDSAGYTEYLAVFIRPCSVPSGPVYWRKVGEATNCAASSPPCQFGDPHRAGTAADAPGTLLRENRQGASSWLLPGRDRRNLDWPALPRERILRNRPSWTRGRHYGSRRGDGPGLLAGPRGRQAMG